ncbi:MAG: hypothetical protein PGN07_08260 [Aeromicrobium erythreum]
MRVYVALDAAALARLDAGEPAQGERFVAASEDEQDEFDALETAAEHGRVVAVAEVDAEDDPVTLAEVEALHVDADGSGDLAWYATQEIGAVLDLLRR